MTESHDVQAAGILRRAWLVSIGTELTLGQSVDTNAAWLAQQLAAIGIRAERHLTVGDELPAIREILAQAAAACDLIIVTGGLGPTEDDLTRRALAEAAGVELETDAASLEQIRVFFAKRRRAFTERNRVQALIPRTGRAVANTCGTAPGIFIELNGTPCYALPGVPFEMKAMFARDVWPHLRAASAGRVLRQRRLNCFGLGESDIGARLRDLMAPDRNPQVGTTAELGIIGVRINAEADTVDEAETLLGQTEAEIRARLGHIVFGRDSETLAAVVGERLAARRETVCTAESCTGGLIAKMLTDTAGSSAYFVGGAVTYANELKQQLLGVPADTLAELGAVSEPVARAMAMGARERFAATYALAVTGIAGPSGGTTDKPVGLVYFGLATPADVTTRELRFGSDSPREVTRARAAHAALNLLRLALVG
jgi:nicotinamide-nucleotide amidase